MKPAEAVTNTVALNADKYSTLTTGLVDKFMQKWAGKLEELAILSVNTPSTLSR